MVKHQRQSVITRIVTERGVASQEQLVRALAREGFPVSQTTVSRDLKELGLVRLRTPDGIVRYGSAADAGTLGDDEGLRRMAPQFLLEAESTGNMVVIRTSPGNAQGLAAALDKARPEGVAGTVAGDDTILVVCSQWKDAGEVREKMVEYALRQR